MTRFALTLEFDGGPFMGLQRQPNGPTVQNSVEDAVLAITGEKVAMHSAGRTDAGVHALAMCSHVDIEKDITPFRLMEALNALLRPDPIAVTECRVMPDTWHARFSCNGRRYYYRIINRRTPLTLLRGRAWQIAQPLDTEAMHSTAQILVGKHDFTTFRSAHCQSRSPVKSLDYLNVRTMKDDLGAEEIIVEAGARSFLHHQVRSMVGCLALVGMGRWDGAQIKTALEARDRQKLGLNAPPEGLYFAEACYPETPEKS